MLWLLLVAVACAALLLGVDEVFVHTARGQQVDDAGFRGAAIGRARIIDQVRQVLDLISVVALASATAVIGTIAVLRRRPGVAVLAVLLVAGSNLTTEILKKMVLQRPYLGVGSSGSLRENSLPSGHTTVALSLAVAVVLVVPPRVRGLVAVAGAAYGAVTGVATVSAGWHRPSDAVAASLVVGCWAAVLGAGAAAVTPPAARAREARDAHPAAVTVLVVGALLLLAAGVSAMLVTSGSVPVTGNRPRLFLAYCGGAATIAGMALAVMAALLVVAHRVVPARPERRSPSRTGHARVREAA